MIYKNVGILLGGVGLFGRLWTGISAKTSFKSCSWLSFFVAKLLLFCY